MTSHADGWLTIREAASTLGVSELTVRRRIKDGKVAHRLEDGKYYVNLSAATAPHVPSDDPPSTAPPTPPSPVDLSHILEEYSQLARTAGRAGALEERIKELEARNASLQDGLLTLSNRNGWLESKLEERERDIKLLTDSRRKISWWRRLFGAPSAN